MTQFYVTLVPLSLSIQIAIIILIMATSWGGYMAVKTKFAIAATVNECFFNVRTKTDPIFTVHPSFLAQLFFFLQNFLPSPKKYAP